MKCKLACSVCKKEYTRKTSLDKHKILCDFKLKTKLERQVEVEELGDMPNHYQLIRIVQELSLKITSMEEKISEMQKIINKKKNKINIISWLNENVKPEIGFLEWVNTSIIVNETHFEYLMENSLYNTLQKVFEYILPQNQETYPISSFSQKQGVIYICEKNEEGFPEWKVMELTNMVLLLKTISKHMLKVLGKWKIDNKELFDTNDKISDSFNKALIKLMDISYSQDAKMGKIKNILYNYLKITADFTAVELEF